MILDNIVQKKKQRLNECKNNLSTEEMMSAAFLSKRESISFFDAIGKKGLSIIGEFKKASPSMGVINNQLDLTDRIDQYNNTVDAISCLTEEDYFHGSVEYLKQIRKLSPLPILRKDFIIDEYQIYEAKVIEADAILLIAAILDDEDLHRFYSLSYGLGLDVLVEVHNEEEMRRAIQLNARIIGVNNRDLTDFTIRLETTKRLSQMLPKETLFISESGISSSSDIASVKNCGVDGVLVGRAFMESDNPSALAAQWKGI